MNRVAALSQSGRISMTLQSSPTASTQQQSDTGALGRIPLYAVVS